MANNSSIVSTSVGRGNVILSTGFGARGSYKLTIKSPQVNGSVVAFDNAAITMLGNGIDWGTLKNGTFFGPRVDNNSAFTSVRSASNVGLFSVQNIAITELLTGGTAVVGTPEAIAINNGRIQTQKDMLILANKAITFTGTGLFTTADDGLISSRFNSINHGTASSTVRARQDFFFSGFTVDLSGSVNWNSGRHAGIYAQLGTIAFDGSISTGSLATSVGLDVHPIEAGLQKSLTKTMGNIEILAHDAVTFSPSSNLTTRYGSIVIAAGIDKPLGSPAGIGDLNLGNQSRFVANGGNIVMLAKGDINSGIATAPGADDGNFIRAVALSTGGGGGVEIKAATSSSDINNVIKARPTPASVSLGGQTVVVTPLSADGLSKGTISIGSNVTFSNGNSYFNVRKPAIVIQSIDPTSAVNMDSVTIESILPTAGAINDELAEPASQAPLSELLVDTGDFMDSAPEAQVAETMSFPGPKEAEFGGRR